MLQRGGGRVFLRFLFGMGGATADFDAVQNGDGYESRIMDRTGGFGQFIVDVRVKLFLAVVLELAFRVVFDGRLDVVEHFVEIGEEREADAAGFLQTAVEIDGTEEGLEQIAERRRLGAAAGGRFAFAEKQGEIQLELACVGDVGGLVRDVGADFREEAFVHVFERLEDVVRRDDLQDGVAKKFEPLVVGRRLLLLGRV